MRAVWLEVPAWFLAERRRLGHDKKDEVWDGVLHMVPPPSSAHDLYVGDLFLALTRIGSRRGLRAMMPTSGLFGSRKNYRIPDVTLARADQISERGLEGAVLVVEVLSPRDESRDKFPFYRKVGVEEIWLSDPRTRATEIYRLAGKRYVDVPFAGGVARSPALDIELAIVKGKLRLRDGGDVASI